MGINQHRETPADLFEALNQEFRFDIDVAADRSNRACHVWITEHQDAMKTPWFPEGRESAFCNPPWESVHKWFDRACGETQRTYGSTAVVVSHVTCAAKSVPWLEKADEIRFLVPRPQFKVPEGWWKCTTKGCGGEFFWPELSGWPGDGESPGASFGLCPHCQGMCAPHKDSSNPRDVQVTVYRHMPVFNRSVAGFNDGPRFTYWNWK